MKRFFLLLYFGLNFICLFTYAKIPTLDSLLRNANNPDISSNLMKLSMKVKKISDGGEMSDANKPEKIVKLAFFREDKDKIHLFQAIFEQQKSEQKLLRKHYNALFSETLKLESDHRKNMFYSSLLMLVWNKSLPLKNFLKINNEDFYLNNNLINKEKLKKLEEYKNYLLQIKQDPSKKKALASPLRPKEFVEKIKLKKLLQQRLYLEDNLVKLNNKNGKFFWEFKLSRTKGHFSHDKHQISDLLFEDNGNVDNQVEIEFDQYFLVDNSYELPKFIIFRNAKSIYLLEILEAKYLNSNITEFRNFVTKEVDPGNYNNLSHDIEFIY